MKYDQLTSLGVDCESHSMCCVEDILYIVGGREESGASSEVLMAFDFSTGDWARRAPMRDSPYRGASGFASFFLKPGRREAAVCTPSRPLFLSAMRRALRALALHLGLPLLVLSLSSLPLLPSLLLCGFGRPRRTGEPRVHGASCRRRKGHFPLPHQGLPPLGR